MVKMGLMGPTGSTGMVGEKGPTGYGGDKYQTIISFDKNVQNRYLCVSHLHL